MGSKTQDSQGVKNKKKIEKSSRHTALLRKIQKK